MRIAISGGGTGGHIYPALALIRELKKQQPDAEFLYIGTEKGLENKIVPREGIPFETIDITGFKRSLSLENFKTIWRFITGVRKSKKLLKKFKPDVVIGTGGYVCGPVVYAASRLHIPSIIHEQNSVAGLTNKFLSHFVTKVAICFEEASEAFPSEKIVFTGNPRAQEVVGIDAKDSLQKYGLDPEKKTVLVFGGSRGARGVNEAIENVLPEWNKRDYQLLYVTGEVHFEKIKDTLSKFELGSHISVVPFIYDMPSILNAVDLVVARAGATTLAEITALGLPSILIPSPYVTANHQEKNARALEKKGAAILITEEALKNTDLMKVIDTIVLDDEQLKTMRCKAKELGTPDAADRLAKLVMEIR